MDKQELRGQLRLARKNMPFEEVEAKSRTIVDRLIEDLEWSALSSIHIYRPMPSLSEVDTAGLLEYLAAHHPEVDIVNQGRSRTSPTDQKFDLIIVPTLGFDENCNRLGWGGGWYDRFLADQPQALKVGLAYRQSLITGGLPVESHDVPLDKIITEDIIFKR